MLHFIIHLLFNERKQILYLEEGKNLHQKNIEKLKDAYKRSEDKLAILHLQIEELKVAKVIIITVY